MYGLSTLLATYTGVASVVLLSEVLDILAWTNAAKQRKLADLSKLPNLLKVMVDQLEHLKEETSEWLGSVESMISLLKEKYNITLGTYGSKRSNWLSITNIAEYRTLVAILYLDSLLANNKGRYADRAVKIVTAMSIFNPTLLPTSDSLSLYGNEQIKLLAVLYGK